MMKIKVWAKAKSEEIIEIPEEELEGLDSLQRDNVCYEWLQDWVHVVVDIGWNAIEE